MRHTRLITLLSLPGLLLCLGQRAAVAGKPLTGDAFLVRGPTEPAPDAWGTIRATEKKNKSELEIMVKKLDPSFSYDVHLEDAPGSNVLVVVGSVQFNGQVGSLSFVEDALPFGAAAPSELEGRALEIRSGGVVYLCGLTPQLDADKGKQGFTKVMDALTRPADVSGSKARGRVEVWRKEKDARERFRIYVTKLPTGSPLDVYIETAPGSNVLVYAATLPSPGDDGEASLKIDTKKGDPLPLLIKDAALLANRCIQLRTGGGEVVLGGIIPDIEHPEAPGKVSGELSGAGEARVELRRTPSKPDRCFTLDLEKQPKGAVRDVFVQDAGQVYVLVDRIDVNKKGKARLRIRTRKGESLPTGAKTLGELAGRPIRVLDPKNGDAVVFEGVVPSID